MYRKILAFTVSAAALSFGATSAMAQTTTINGGGSTLAEPAYIAAFEAYSNANPSIAFSYEGVGSGTGQEAFFNNDITQFQHLQPTALVYGTIVGTTVHFGASDAALSLGGSYDITATSGYTGSNGFAGSAVDGPLIQIPTFGTAIAFPYVNAGATKTIQLTDDQICGILSGELTNWNQLFEKVTAGTIQVIYDDNSSGTTYLLANHLNSVCTEANSSFPVLPVPITTTFASLFDGHSLPSNFTGESGSKAIASTMLNTNLSFSYLSPAYTSIAPESASTTNLQVANVQGANSIYYAPTVANTELALENPGSGSTNPTPPTTLSGAQNPTNWVPVSPLANKGYPVVGYTTLDLSTCYSNATIGSALISFLDDLYEVNSYENIIINNGFVPLADDGSIGTDYVKAIKHTFLSNTSGYKLDIDNAKACSDFPGR